MQQSVLTSDMATWMQFFRDASILPEYCTQYANKFTENRIRFDMLTDIDKPLLNEMGISAIGDVLAILKHSKVIIAKIEEKKQTLNNGSTESALNIKSRCEVAKRIIETYLCDPEAKPLNEKITSSTSSSSLSADLISRLNFNATSNAVPSSAKVTFNGESLNQVSKPIVSSTTTNEDDMIKKRKYNELTDEHVNGNNVEVSHGKPLEYMGLLKQSPQKSTIISLKTNSSPHANDNLKPTGKSIKSRLSVPSSLTPKSVPQDTSSLTSNSKIIKLNRSNDSNATKQRSSLDGLQIKTINTDFTEKPVNEKQSIFKRLKHTNTKHIDMEKSSEQVNKNTSLNSSPELATIKLMSQFGLKKNTDNQMITKKVTTNKSIRLASSLSEPANRTNKTIPSQFKLNKNSKDSGIDNKDIKSRLKFN